MILLRVARLAAASMATHSLLLCVIFCVYLNTSSASSDWTRTRCGFVDGTSDIITQWGATINGMEKKKIKRYKGLRNLMYETISSNKISCLYHPFT